MPVKYELEEIVNGKLVKFELHDDGKFMVDGVERAWYKTSLMPDAKPWIPEKRKSFKSLVKQMIREGDFEKPKK
jgi:hypothetical protein